MRRVAVKRFRRERPHYTERQAIGTMESVWASGKQRSADARQLSLINFAAGEHIHITNAKRGR